MNQYQISNSIPKHHAVNLGAIFAAADVLGLDLNLIAKNLEDYKQVAGRGQEIFVNYDGKNIRIIDDSYNANPASMKAAIDHLSSLKSKRKIAVIADMKELGDSEVVLHEEIGEYINQIDIDLVITVGKLSENIFNVLKDSKRLQHFDDKHSMQKAILSLLQDGDLLMLKGSKSTLMYEVVEYIKSIDTKNGTAETVV
jgi:UDP-N-acetylmuramoyl-tripeptide--D-alanyl-D-alanine ligase